jgi:hypothetical protein
MRVYKKIKERWVFEDKYLSIFLVASLIDMIQIEDTKRLDYQVSCVLDELYKLDCEPNFDSGIEGITYIAPYIVQKLIREKQHARKVWEHTLA